MDYSWVQVRGDKYPVIYLLQNRSTLNTFVNALVLLDRFDTDKSFYCDNGVASNKTLNNKTSKSNQAEEFDVLVQRSA